MCPASHRHKVRRIDESEARHAYDTNRHLGRDRAASLSLALVLAACGDSDLRQAIVASGGTKAGQPVVLTMANAIDGGQLEQLRAFVDE